MSLKVAIVGCGKIAGARFEEISKMPELRDLRERGVLGDIVHELVPDESSPLGGAEGGAK